MPRNASEVVTIFWRDIPAQVNAQSGRDRHQVILSGKFQRAIDRAKRKAHIDTAHEDIAQWRRVSTPFTGDPAEAAQRRADELEAGYTREHLGGLAFAGGFERDVVKGPVDTDELAALEELDEDEAE
jgi:hypothetical protein